MKQQLRDSETFTQLPTLLRKTPRLSDTQKIFISYVLGYQDKNLICFESNETLAENLGKTEASLRKQITKLNKLPFFKSEDDSKPNEFGKWKTGKLTTVDKKLLFDWLAWTEASIQQLSPAINQTPVESVLTEASTVSVISKYSYEVLRPKKLSDLTEEESDYLMNCPEMKAEMGRLFEENEAKKEERRIRQKQKDMAA